MKSELTPAALADYRATAERRAAEQRHAVEQRRERAMVVAREAAGLLRAGFGATQVLLFGSLAHGQWFSLSSDIDLAAAGISAEDYLIAVAHLQDLSEFSVDLVRIEQAPAHLRETIEHEGSPL